MDNDRNPFDETLPISPARPSPWLRRVGIGAVAVAAVAGIGLAAARSSDFGPGGFGMGGNFMHARMAGFAEGRVDRILERIDATPEQTEKFWAIVDGARSQMRPKMREFREARGEALDILTAATIDRAAAETLRAERIAAIDEASKTMTAAILDAAEVLTPEQRTKLKEHFEQRRGERRW